jgi:hypothetical protein
MTEYEVKQKKGEAKGTKFKTYSEGSYSVFRNDEKHLDKAVNKYKNKIVSPEMADILYMASDHLPVIIDLKPLKKK